METKNRTHEHDHRVVPSRKMWQREPHELRRRDKVEIHDLHERLRVSLTEPSNGACPCGCNDQVEPAEAIHSVHDQRVAKLAVANVASKAVNVRDRPLLCCKCYESVLPTSRRQYMAAAARERRRHGPAHAR